MSRYKNILILIILFVLLVIGIVVFVLVLKSKNKPKRKEDLIISDSSIIVSKRGINLDSTTVDTSTSNWLDNWPLTTQPIKYVRTYSVSKSWVTWLEYLTDKGVYVFIGINPDQDQKNANVTALINLLNKWKKSFSNRLSYIIGLSVANEPKGSEVKAVINTAIELRKQLAANNLNLEVPITACFVYDNEWIDFGANKLKHPELYKNGGGPLDNVICFNIYGNLFGGTNGQSTPDQLTKSLDWLKGYMIPNQITSIRKAIKGSNMPPDSQLWITEVGWTSEPLLNDAKGKGWASLENEKRFYNNFLTANTDIGVEWPEYLFWFTVRDTRTPTKNESFGLLDSNGKPKFTGNLPICGSSCDSSCKCPGGTVCNNKSCGLPICGSSCDSSCKCPDGTVCDSKFAICAPSDCTSSSISCPSGYQCNQTTKSCIPIPAPSDDCYKEGENPFGLGCTKTACCPGTTLRLHPKDSTSNQPYYICSSNTSYPSNISPKCDPKTSPICLQSSFCKLPTCGSSCNPSCKCPDGTFCDSGTCTNNSPPCYENDEDVFGDKCKKGVKCCDGSTLCRNKNNTGNYKYYCHKGNSCIPGDSKVDPGSSIFPPCPTGNCNVKNSKLCKYK
jgi:hypothetical protein